MREVTAIAILGIAALGLTGCSSQPANDTSDQTEVTMTVAAAASLQRSFDEIAIAFEKENPGVEVATISYDGSSTLATQIVEGAPFDVFASADERNMQTVVDAGLASAPEVFATNTLVIAVPKGNPAKVAGLADLADVTTVLCAPEVPCGSASEKLLGNAGVSFAAASLEQNVTSVLQKVAAGEADAGLVYRTDVAGDDAVEGIEAEGAAEVVNKYPIAALSESKHSAAARAFVDFVLGTQGQQILAGHGFGSAS